MFSRPHFWFIIQLRRISYFHSSCGTSLYLIAVGCWCLAGSTLWMYKSPTFTGSNFGPPSPIQQGRTSQIASGSWVKKNGSEYLSCPVLFLTRWTVAWNIPLVWRSRYWPTLQTSVPGTGSALTHLPSWLSTSSAGTLSWRTSVSPVLELVGLRQEGKRGIRIIFFTYTKSQHVHQVPLHSHHCLQALADSAVAASQLSGTWKRCQMSSRGGQTLVQTFGRASLLVVGLLGSICKVRLGTKVPFLAIYSAVW